MIQAQPMAALWTPRQIALDHQPSGDNHDENQEDAQAPEPCPKFRPHHMPRDEIGEVVPADDDERTGDDQRDKVDQEEHRQDHDVMATAATPRPQRLERPVWRRRQAGPKIGPDHAPYQRPSQAHPGQYHDPEFDRYRGRECGEILLNVSRGRPARRCFPRSRQIRDPRR